MNLWTTSSECLVILPLPSSLLTPTVGVFLWCTIVIGSWPQEQEVYQDHLHAVMTELNCIIYSLKNVKV